MSAVQVYKLITGEEIIARIGEEKEDTITLKSPRVVAIGPGPNGQMSVTLIPLFASCPDGDFELAKHAIVGTPIGDITEQLEKGYVAQTSGIELI